MRASLALACGVHSALLFVVWKSHGTRPAADSSVSSEEAVWELDPTPLEPEAPPVAREADEVASSEGPSARAAAPGASYEGRRDNSVPAPSGSEAPASSAAPPGSAGAPPGADGWSFSPTGRGGVDLGLGSARGPKSFTYDPNAKVDVPSEARPTSKTGGLVEALAEEDAKHGFWRGGAVKTAVEVAAHTTDAPEEGKATFDIAVDTNGECHINVLSSNGDFERWNRLAEAIRKNLAGKRVRFATGAKGLRVVVDVEARMQFPDGTSPQSLGGKAGMSDQGPAASYRGKVCGVGISLAGLGGGCSPENAGTQASRMVYSRITSERSY